MSYGSYVTHLTHKKAGYKYLKSDHDGCHEVELPCSSNDTLGNHIAPHDTSEYVHQQGVHLRYYVAKDYWGGHVI